VSQQTVKVLEGGVIPRLTTAMKLARALDTNVATLWPMERTHEWLNPR
jgi:hypothetical protein